MMYSNLCLSFCETLPLICRLYNFTAYSMYSISLVRFTVYYSPCTLWPYFYTVRRARDPNILGGHLACGGQPHHLPHLQLRLQVRVHTSSFQLITLTHQSREVLPLLYISFFYLKKSIIKCGLSIQRKWERKKIGNCDL